MLVEDALLFSLHVLSCFKFWTNTHRFKTFFDIQNILCRYKTYPIICLIRNETIHIHIRDSEPGVMVCSGPNVLVSDWSIHVTWPQYWPLIGQYMSRDLNTGLWLVNTGPDVHRLETFMCSPPGPRAHFRTGSYFILLLFLYVCTLYKGVKHILECNFDILIYYN